MSEREEQGVLEVLRSGWLATGPKTQALEAAFADQTHRAHAVAVSSGTAALELALRALGVGPGDEVLCPALTWPSPAHAVVRLGAEVVLVDVDADEWNASAAAFADARNERTRAAIVIDQFGNPARAEAIAAALDGVAIIEDSACALGSRFADGEPCGSLGAIGCFSLHPRKIVTCGEGGVCVTDDPALAEAMRVARNHGQAGAGVFTAPDANLRMSDLAAAVALAQLERLDTILGERRTHAEAMSDRLAERYQLQRAPEGSEPNHQTFGAQLPADRDREAFIADAAARGVQVGRLSYAVDRLGQVGAQGPLPVAHGLHDRGVAFPLFPTMTLEERATVLEVLEALA